MHWRFRKLTYDILIPKLDKNIFQLNEKETADYFAWFMERVPERVAYVSKVCAKELRIPEEKMDLSPESLVLLWKWFRKRAKTEPAVYSEQDKAGMKFPANIWNDEKQLTLETEYILRDIGMYFGETFRKNYPHIYWTYYTKPRRDFFVNHPLLKGFVDMTTGTPFEAVFEPIHMAGVQASKILKKASQDTDLLRIYKIWEEKAQYQKDKEE